MRPMLDIMLRHSWRGQECRRGQECQISYSCIVLNTWICGGHVNKNGRYSYKQKIQVFCKQKLKVFIQTNFWDIHVLHSIHEFVLSM